MMTAAGAPPPPNTQRLLRGMNRRLKRNAPSHEPSVADFQGGQKLAEAMLPDRHKLVSVLGEEADSSWKTHPSHVVENDNGDDEEEGKHSNNNEDDEEDDDNETAGRPHYTYDYEDDEPVEWTLKVIDENSTEPQSMEQELQRLRVLQSYMLLDSQGQEEFDRITALGAKLFNAPVCLISLVDLGRQWFLSKYGTHDVETPRKHAFCAHVIWSKERMLIVPDATKDFRFCNSPLVTGGPKIRFYAGAALISPEGCRLGSFCVTDREPRPESITTSELATLRSLSAMAIDAMVSRRTRLLKQEYEKRLHQAAATLVETQQTLLQVRQSLDHHLDETLMMQQQQQQHQHHNQRKRPSVTEVQQLFKASECLSVQSQICSAAARTIYHDIPTPQVDPELTTHHDHGGSSSPLQSTRKQPQEQRTAATPKKDRFEGFIEDTAAVVEIVEKHRAETNKSATKAQKAQKDQQETPSTNVEALFSNINHLVGTFHRADTVTVEVHKSVPKIVPNVEDLLLFRAVWNLISHCMTAAGGSSHQDQHKQAREKNNNSKHDKHNNKHYHEHKDDDKNSHETPPSPPPLSLKSGLRIKATDEDGVPELLVEAFHGVVPTQRITNQQAKAWFTNATLQSPLYAVAQTVRSLGGRYGQFMGPWVALSGLERAADASNAQCIYWFRIPYSNDDVVNGDATTALELFPKTRTKMHRGAQQQNGGSSKEHKKAGSKSSSSSSHGSGSKSDNNHNNHHNQHSRKKEMEKLLLEDPFLAQLIESGGCGGGACHPASTGSNQIKEISVPSTSTTSISSSPSS